MPSPQITNLAIVLGVMQLVKKLDLLDSNIVFYLRCLYIASNALIMLSYFIIHLKIKQKNDMTTLKYVETPGPLSGSHEPKLVTTTIKGYDQSELQKAIKGTLTGVAMMCVMHFWFKFTQPLVIQSILPLKSALESNVAQIHLFGKPASGDLKRPFKVTSMFGGTSGPDDSPQAIKAAEKVKVSGAKEE
ncbi:Inorganic phosphate transport protein PHO88 [Neolecta irregularis DAH-3]|uniref:Inorganic phosphate transport protein PHO88 n=1 Tax=Neolecta irregularis (strain DAH-3) TaxID=1198029 RepID=A0A1U7LH04_NEOID|nr:Inorganic phosphate transport protein PHO88 [Neolecta irregularis DAH-3]|eukprot:OLL21940.1 Inorganic phosphate transport protein PHO88 [Neolecta irregularis DAH-3]